MANGAHCPIFSFLVVEKFFPYTSGTTPSPSAHIFPIIKTP